jgi:hypothetical protein
MGKKTKEHRAKVAKRNRRIAEEKGKMQRTFDKLLKEQMEKFQSEENLNVQIGDKPLEFSVVDPNDIEPEVDGAGFTIEDRELNVDVESVNEVSTIKESVTSEDEEQ